MKELSFHLKDLEKLLKSYKIIEKLEHRTNYVVTLRDFTSIAFHFTDEVNHLYTLWFTIKVTGYRQLQNLKIEVWKDSITLTILDRKYFHIRSPKVLYFSPSFYEDLKKCIKIN